MKILVQRVLRASVSVSGRTVSSIERGLLLFVAVEHGDTPREAVAGADKMATLRVFSDDHGRMNRDVLEAPGAVLVVPQFTLAGSIQKGRRPSFDGAASPEVARILVERVAQELEERGIPVGRGVFGADMQVELVGDGPVTFLLDLPSSEPSAPSP